jgi:hypothetical protein
MEHIITLTDEQEIGIAHQASHNNLSVDEYFQWRAVQDADRGNSELQTLSAQNLMGKILSEPSIIPSLSTVADEQIAVVVIAREEKAIADAKALEEETGEIIKEEVIIKGL